MAQSRSPETRQAPPPKDLSGFADYQRHLVVYDPAALDGAPRRTRPAARGFITQLLQVLEKFDPVRLDQFPLGATPVWLLHLRNPQFTLGEAIDAAQQFAPKMTFVRNARVSLLQPAAVNDPLYPQQWSLKRIEVEPAWQRFAQAAANQVTVAIIDSGIQSNHEDLQGLAIVGRNVLSGTNNVPDDTGHGTMLAGTVAAITNNARGIAGIVQPPARLRLLVVKFDDARIPPLAYFAAKAVAYAAGPLRGPRRAHIVNASWHVLDDHGALRLALLYAQSRGVLVVAAAGNDGGDNTRIPTIPASYAFGNMIAVMASDRHDDKAGFSNYGATVDIAAPGVDVLTTGLYFLNPAYREYGGTSAAAAQVSAAAAMLLAIDASWQPNQIRDHLVASPDPLTNLRGTCRAEGRLNLRRAVVGPFSIVQPSGGQRLRRGSIYDVEWISEYNSPVVNTVDITINGVGPPLASGVPNNGRCQVTWPNQAIANAVLRLSCVQKNLYAESAPFDII